MISKKLLSSVLDKNVIPSHEWDNNIEYGYSINGTRYTHSINIYELAHKCKEWAYNERCKLLSFKDGEEVFKCIVRSDRNNEWLIETKSSSEPRCIFDACQWILDNKEANR